MSAQTYKDHDVGDYVELTKNRKGVIRFKGEMTGFGKCFGIELDEAVENGNDGTLDGDQFFECDDGKGIFLKPSAIKRKLASNTSQFGAAATAANGQSTNGDVQKQNEAQNESKNSKLNGGVGSSKRSSATKNGASRVTTKRSSANKKDPKLRKAKSVSTPTTTSSSSASSSSTRMRNLKTPQTPQTPKSPRSPRSGGTRTPKTPKSPRLSGSASASEEFIVPTELAALAKLQLIYPRLSNLKLAQSKRIEIIGVCAHILEDEKCEESTVKYGIAGYKKVFVEQMKDKKFAVHKALYGMLKILIVRHSKAYKAQNLFFLKNLIIHMAHLKASEKKALAAIVAVVGAMTTYIGVAYDKQLIIMLNEFMRNATSSKHKTVKQQTWQFIHAALAAKYEATPSGKLIASPVLDSIEKGLKTGLSSTDKTNQDGSFQLLHLLYGNHETERVEKLFGRMSATAQKQFAKKYPQSTPAWFGGGVAAKSDAEKKKHTQRKVSVGRLQIGNDFAKNSFGKRDSLEDKMLSTTSAKSSSSSKKSGKKTPVKTPTKSPRTTKGAKEVNSKNGKTKSEKKPVKTKDKDKELEKNKKLKNGKRLSGKTTPKNDKNASKNGKNKNASKDKKSTKSKSAAANGKKEDAGDKQKADDDDDGDDDDDDASGEQKPRMLQKNTHQRSDKNLLSDADGSDNDLGALLGGADGGDLFSALDLPLPIQSDTETAGGGARHDDDDEVDKLEVDDEEVKSNQGAQGSDEDDSAELSDGEYSNFPHSFLTEEHCVMNWKMLDFLCQSDKTHILLSVLSRMSDFKLHKTRLGGIGYERPIPDTRPLSSDDETVISDTQLSYNLMRLLSTDAGGGGDGSEAVSSYLLRQSQQIVLHSLAVYHETLSAGNVYHGRVLLEILLNTWPKSLMSVLTRTSPSSRQSSLDSLNLERAPSAQMNGGGGDDAEIMFENTQLLFKNALFRNLHQGNLNSFFLDLICYRPQSDDKYRQILPLKKRLISLFKNWGFMQYLLQTSTSYKAGIDGSDDVATKYATFFIDLVARSAAIPEVSPLFEGHETRIVDAFIGGILDVEKKRTTWHRTFCGQILIQFMDICSRPTIMDPTQLLAAEAGLAELEPSPNILFPLFDKCLQRLHSYIPKLSNLVVNYQSDYKFIPLPYTVIKKPFGQIRLHCLELLTISADFAQFECGNVLGKIPMRFWNYLVEMAFIHKNNNIFLCHFRRLIHLTMIFRRRILKHLFVEKKMLDRFINFYATEKYPVALHGYILQMTFDIWQHDVNDDEESEEEQPQDDEDEEDEDEDDDDDEEKPYPSQYL
eukprot:CAMPEP_0202694316 /NCGR_PEP_ID=MMETSP1385-20130828/8200_1 /ASSEMBLY_ACC=CAM_ASM_000861 /TAXON_ID=933848 /ORGANISM="Elphidium margaritaceum" /LENGTH=1305 /DNA_ID=CAMNT_0049350135 /DNA_START=24 /DNA_END=3941 /DNA_ORIENTATION=+